MLNASPLVAFVATTKPDEARAFYETTLGLVLREDNPFALVFTVQSTMLRIQKVKSFVPADHTVLGWTVEDIRATMIDLVRRGVRFERYAGLPQDELGIWSSPAGAHIAWFKDPDGNVLSLTEW